MRHNSKPRTKNTRQASKTRSKFHTSFISYTWRINNNGWRKWRRATLKNFKRLCYLYRVMPIL